LTRPNLESVLLEAATTLGDVLDFHELAGRLGNAMSVLPGLRLGGLSVYDHEREAVDRYTVEPTRHGATSTQAAAQSRPPVHQETPLQGSEVELFEVDGRMHLSLDLATDRSLQLHKQLYEMGVRRYTSVAMELDGRLLGAVFAGFHRSDPLGDSTRVFMERLAGLATSVLWSCLTHARFERGDRRRDTLVELAKVINTSLKVETVIGDVQPLLSQLPDVCLSQVYILESDNQTCRSYRHTGALEGQEPYHPKPELVSVASTAMSWVVRHCDAYESDDLDKRLAFEADEELRRVGARRYSLAPMVVRDRLIGGLLIGTTDPHPIRKVDRWMHAHIALQLGLALSNAMQHEQLRQLTNRLKQQNVYLREEIQSCHGLSEMVGEAAAMGRVKENIARVANTDATVLITGETGVGKELVARAIHAGSARSDQPMVKVNCAAIPEGMVESELFGHERGAFTSAVERRIGRFELAHEGTLYLDEVGELPLALQPKLLRVLQDGEFERVGGTRTLVAKARIISATNRNLEKAVESGTFRADLFYRLNVFPIDVPPLDKRREDIPLLVEHFVSQLSRPMGKQIESIDPASMDYLLKRQWPGNVRELRHVVERAMILCDGRILHIDTGEVAVDLQTSEPSPTCSEALPPLRALEAEHIRRALQKTGGIIQGPNGAAELLGLKPSTLRFRMKRLGISRRG